MTPTDFPTVRLRRLGTIRPSSVDKKRLPDEISVRLCNYTDVYYNDEITGDLDFMRASATTNQIETFTLRAGDVLITKDSESPDDIGVPAYTPNDLNGVLCGYHLSLIRPDTTRIHPRYLFWALKADPIRAQMRAAALGITRFALRSLEVADLRLPLPGNKEQVRIADYLDRETDRIDAALQRKSDLIGSLADRRRTVIVLGVCGLLGRKQATHDPSLAWTRDVRTPWPAVKIKYVARLGTGHTPSRAHPEYWENRTIPWITTGEIQQVRDDRAEVIIQTREMISELGLANSAAELRPKGTVVLCRTASAGYSAIMGANMATSQDFATWTCSDRLLPRYLLMCLRAMRGDLLGRLAFGSTHKTIYMPDIEGLKIPLPSVEEQHRILDQISKELTVIDDLSDRLESQIALLLEKRQALITAAVTGRVD